MERRLVGPNFLNTPLRYSMVSACARASLERRAERVRNLDSLLDQLALDVIKLVCMREVERLFAKGCEPTYSVLPMRFSASQ
jgi:hypothetical protein